VLIGAFLDDVPPAARIRLFRALLPSLEALPGSLFWHDAFPPCFVEVQAPHMEEFKLWLEDNVTGFTFPWQTFIAAPALSLVEFGGHDDFEWLYILASIAAIGLLVQETVEVLRSLTTALRRGALQNLRRVGISNCNISNVDFKEFVEALVYSGCAERMVSLKFKYCGFGVKGMRSFADRFNQGAFPALKELNFSSRDLIWMWVLWPWRRH